MRVLIDETAELVRTEGAIDETARQLHVIAQISDPFVPRAEGQMPLKIGQYVTARLEGRMLPDALVIPNNAIYQGTYVYVVENGILRRRDVDILWQNEREAIVSSGLAAGDQLVTTSLGQVTSGVRVSILGQEDFGHEIEFTRCASPCLAAGSALLSGEGRTDDRLVCAQFRRRQPADGDDPGGRLHRPDKRRQA